MNVSRMVDTRYAGVLLAQLNWPANQRLCNRSSSTRFRQLDSRQARGVSAPVRNQKLLLPTLRYHFFRNLAENCPSRRRVRHAMRPVRPTKPKKFNRVPRARGSIQPVKPSPKLGRYNLRRPAAPEEVGTRAETAAAIAEAKLAHDRLVEAIDILPEGIVFL